MKLKSIWNKMEYEIELVAQLLVVFSTSFIFGFIESWYVPTDTMTLPLFGRWSYYHLFLVALMISSSFSISLFYFRWIVEHRKKYILLMCFASIPLCLMLEDVAWFLARWQAIRLEEWTVIPNGWAANFGLTYIPAWYFAVMIFSFGLFWLASVFSTKGYNAFLERRETDGTKTNN